MENVITDKPTIINKKLLTGKWELTKKLSNTHGVRAFGGHLLSHYKHPLTKKTAHLRNTDNEIQTGFMVNATTMILRPEEDPEHRLQLEWLLAHPEVKVEGATLDTSIKKVANTSITLKNLDNQMMEDIDNDDFIDMVIGKLSNDSGPYSLGLKQLRWVLAYFNLPYYDLRHISNAKTEKKLLRTKLKSHARKKDPQSGNYFATEINEILEEVENYEVHYLIKEMIRKHIIVFTNSVFKYNNVAIGSNLEGVILYLKNNPNIFNEAQAKLLPLLKREGFN